MPTVKPLIVEIHGTMKGKVFKKIPRQGKTVSKRLE
jgi:hypothetical protein